MQRKRWLILAGVVAALLALAFFAAACGDEEDGGEPTEPVATTPAETEEPTEPEATEPADETPSAETELEIASAPGLTFDTEELTASAGQPFTVAFDNVDDAIPHNFAIYRDEDHTDLIDGTEIEEGPVTQTHDFEALEAGTYYYRCDVHPTTMTGTLTVE